ncbi:MAG: ABC transporter permease [Bacteroidales bacterium]|nr:ABC transporter permease [Bacteroidales bacterium]MCM1146422.1 ABC transporter permease [Bacteroidales bacterium]MCM1205140.1 ABC transporter permease [Bacillota bacterium]MCM1509387.1 ABC transporter permease [Clostridium sp.]
MNNILRHIRHICAIWQQEITSMLKDEGMLLILLILPLSYPVLYSWVYNNEVVHEVPVVVVDKSHSSLSRKFIQMYDASPEVRVCCYADNLKEAKDIVGHQEAYGVIYFPEDFAKRVNRMEQATIGVYCDMSLMLAYKNVYQTAVTIQGLMGEEIQTKFLGNYTEREDEVATMPLRAENVPIFNTTGGYGNFILPGVLILILQQTLLLGMGLWTGTLREETGRIIPRSPMYNGTLKVIGGRWMAYFLLYTVLAAYILLAIPKIFSFVSIIYWKDFFLFLIPFLMSCIFFGMTAMSIIRQREDVFLIVVFSSVLLLFMAGVSWPASNIPAFWKYFSWLFPSTFGIKGFIAMNSMGARLSDIRQEILALWIQAAIYFLTTLFIYRQELKK